MAEQLPKWTAQKIAILVIVVVFFVSSFTLSAMVIWEEFFTDNNSNTATVEQDLAQPQEGDMLAGTQLENYTPVEEVNELQIIDQVEGQGKEVSEGGSVVAHYTGAVAATGTIFESSFDSGEPVPFPLANVIQGWQEGIPGMREGGKRRLIIPAEQAYGANPPADSGIPANAALVFDVELVAVTE